jgi:hypothetical protein
MGLLSRLLVILLLCLAAIVLPPAPAQAQEGASITLSPASGVPGEEVTVYGYNFTPSKWVDVYYYLDASTDIFIEDVRADADGHFELTFVVPESYTGKHRVLAMDEEHRSDYEDFTVKPGLTASPEEGPVGTNVTVTGMGFARNERNIEVRYYVNGSYETVRTGLSAGVNGSWQTSFQVPSSPKGSHKIDARGENSTSSAVQDAAFKVTPSISLDRSSGSPGENITMTGNGFVTNERDIKILFDGQVASMGIIRADGIGFWQASFVVPEKPKGTYSVIADGEITKKEQLTALGFQIGPGIVLAPTEGHVGTELAVTGGGFAVSKDVDIYYEADKITTETTDTKGSFQISLTVPESLHGARMVTARDSAGNNATAIFTMESDPPGTPELISPADGSRVGFVGKIRPTFEWTEVEDESGVYYSLQIARSANVTADGFAEALRSITRLVSNNCTLNATQALPYGTYYWMVRAVDRAGNAGNWTEMRSFRARVMPLWGFILSVVGGVAVIGTLVYYFIIRRRTYYY